jgi:hypothetical protein
MGSAWFSANKIALLSIDGRESIVPQIDQELFVVLRTFANSSQNCNFPSCTPALSPAL